MIQRHIWVSGKVQGVGFRFSLISEAKKYKDVRGFVRNLNDGRVEAVFLGEEKDVLSLSAWCRKGPSSARVTDLEVREEEIDLSLGKFDLSNDSP